MLLSAIPLLSISGPSLNVVPSTWSTAWGAASRAASPATSRIVVPSAGDAPSRGSDNEQPARRSMAVDSHSVVATALFLVWVSGALLVIATWCAGLLSLRRTEKRARRLEHGSLVSLCERLRLRMGIPQSVTLLLSDERQMPMQWGFVRPRVSLPHVRSQLASRTHVGSAAARVGPRAAGGLSSAFLRIIGSIHVLVSSACLVGMASNESGE